MPYAVPSPSTSPSSTTVTTPSARSDASSRPLRHHMRSHSSDAVASTSFIYVHPSSSDRKSSQTWISVAGQSGPKKTAPTPRRAKIFGFTPANDDGPSSQEESPRQGEEDHPSSSGSVSFPLGPSGHVVSALPASVRRPKSVSTSLAAHVKGLKDAFEAHKTAMVRKKSGELVRSSLKTEFGRDRQNKPRSEPSTPTCPKYVHFDTQLEHVKHFLSQQRPAAVSRSGSPVETETEDEREAFPFPAMTSAQAGLVQIKLPNFPTPVNPDQDAYLESLEIQSDGKSLRGVVRVRNLSFEKWVAVRFTLDHWQTVSEVSADHLESMGPMSDRFVFNIRLQDLLARIEEKQMSIAIRYTVGGREIWDNNGGANYRVEFVKRAAPPPVSQGPVSKRQTWSVTNAGQAADRMADLRRELDRLVQDDMDPSPLHAQTRSFTEGSPSAFSTRYDFGNSLKMFGGRAVSTPSQDAPKPSFPIKAIPPYGPSTLIGGMPATLYPEPPKESSPLTPRAALAPDFGSSSKQRQTSYSPLPYPASHPQRPPSPPADPAAMYGSYLSYLPLQDMATSRARFNSFPGGSGSAMQLRAATGTLSYTPLLPPGFRDHRRQGSPFASPSDSPSISPVLSPAMSPQSSSPPRAHSPPLYPTTSPEDPWSRSSAHDTGSTTSSASTASSTSTYSPESSSTSVPDSPVSSVPRPSGPSEFSNFLDRVRPFMFSLVFPRWFSHLSFSPQYCFHQSTIPSHLGVTPSTYDSSAALPIDFTTPRRGIPPSCGTYYSSSNNSSGSSTPSRDEMSTTPMDNGFAAFASHGPPAIAG